MTKTKLAIFGVIAVAAYWLFKKKPSDTTPPPILSDNFVMSEMTVKVTGGGTILDMYWLCEFSSRIVNEGAAAGTHEIVWWDNYGNSPTCATIVLAPGGIYNWALSRWADFRRVPDLTIALQGDWRSEPMPGVNYAQAIAKANMNEAG